MGLHSQVAEYLETLPLNELMKVVYRDHIVMKHASRKRLATEMTETSKKIDNQLNAENPRSENPEQVTMDVLSKMLVRYLILVPWHLL